MQEDFMNVDTAPTLTLDPFTAEASAVSQLKTKEELTAQFSETANLSEQEKQQVSKFAEQIDLSNSQVILQYGSGTQKKMADFSESALKNVRSKDMGEVGKLLSDVVVELKSFDAEEERGLFGRVKRSANRVTAMKAKYDKVEHNINEIVEALETHQTQLLKDIALLDRMYDVNLAYFKELSMYVAAGKEKLNNVRENELAALKNKAEQSGLAEDAQAVKDLEDQCTRFEKKLYDLELTRTISIQTGPQIRLVQNNDTLMAEKIQSTIVNTIPLWKSQMVLALGIEHSTQAAKAQREVNDMTNELLKKNADTLKMATIDTAKESERGIVDIETLKHTNETLITTLDEVVQIQEDGRRKRSEAEAELVQMENELKSKLLQISGR